MDVALPRAQTCCSGPLPGDVLCVMSRLRLRGSRALMCPLLSCHDVPSCARLAVGPARESQFGTRESLATSVEIVVEIALEIPLQVRAHAAHRAPRRARELARGVARRERLLRLGAA